MSHITLSSLVAGLADPAPVAQTFFVDEEIKASYTLDAIITVVDCAHITPHLEENKQEGIENESVEQVAFADKILLNKIDLVTAEKKEAVLKKTKAINKFAEIIETRQSAVDLDRILGVKAFDLNRVLQMEEDFLDTDGEHEHDLSVTSVGITLPGAFCLSKLNLWLTTLLQTRGTDIFRSKGVLNISGSDSRHVFQGVHMLMGISSSDEGVGRGWKDGEERVSRIVFIGRNLDREELVRGFTSCLAV